MRIMWLSNAPWSNTGYGNQTRTFVPRLKSLLGHQMAVTAFYGLEGSILQLGDTPVYPKGHTPYGNDVLAAHSAHFEADVTLTLLDVWVLEPKLFGRARFVPWFPIDQEPLPRLVREKLAAAYQPIVFSRFGERMCADAGIETRYVPHGVDTKVYSPGDKKAAREKAQLPQDRFIVGMVAANKGNPSRKCFAQQMEAFARFHRRHPDALLYLHTTKSQNGEHGGVNLVELAERLGITDAVEFSDQYALLTGYPDTAMATLYRSFDVLMNVSMGEGFGIPILEAQASGCPVIVGDWTSMSELCFGGWKVAKEDAEPFWTPLAAYQYVPRIGAIDEALTAAFAVGHIDHFGREARQRAEKYDADVVTRDYWAPVLDELAERIGVPKAQPQPQKLIVPGQNGHKPNRAERRALERIK